MPTFKVLRIAFWSNPFLAPYPWPRTNLQTKYEHNWALFSWRNCCTHAFGRGCLLCLHLTSTQPLCTKLIANKQRWLYPCCNKNSSVELMVIWGHFSFSDLACSDLALACYDLACSDLACSDLACSDLGHFFFYQNSYFFNFTFTT